MELAIEDSGLIVRVSNLTMLSRNIDLGHQKKEKPDWNNRVKDKF